MPKTIKELIKEIEEYDDLLQKCYDEADEEERHFILGKREGIKQTVEAVDFDIVLEPAIICHQIEDWQTLKRLLEEVD